ncbi:aldehyde dehydrogenase family protein [Microbacterium indicum]|uniref:aldehyde dehydrogenase family protein n=1 Tax=Microbacterium indicum TaxID=358100 RepID=UPI0003F837EC|nr:aldehyde dehydrogenase family protein [Microbacterium indicum]
MISRASLPSLEPFLPFFLAGEWVEAGGRAIRDVIDPATEQVITTVADATPADVDHAVAAALEAHRSRVWSGMDPLERTRIMNRVAELIERDLEELAILETRDQGKPIERSRADTQSAANTFRHFAGATTRLGGTVVPIDGGSHHAYTVKEPVGPVAAILPWNFPVMTAAYKLGPALAAGCPVIVKPAEDTPLTALRLAALMAEAGIPTGVVSVITGDHVAGATLSTHPDIAKVTFTGSTEVGAHILHASVPGFKRVTLELGGKSPNIIFADADLDLATVTAMRATFGHSGQMCTAGSRILVQRSVLGEMTERLAEAAAKVPVGDGLAGGISVGPMVSEEQRQRVLGYIESGKSQGAQLVTGGGISGPGYYLEPTLFTGVTNDMVIAREEIFGPVAGIIPFDDEAEALRIANDTTFGLAAGVWTTDLARAHRMAQGISAGTVWVNTYNIFHPALSFGGVRDSGLGRDLGEAGLDGFLETKSIVMAV